MKGKDYLLLIILIIFIANPIFIIDVRSNNSGIIWTNDLHTGDRINKLYIMPDINGDSVNEVIAMTMISIWCLDGKTGEPYYQVSPEHECKFITILNDVNGDNISDILYYPYEEEGIFVISGKDGSSLWSDYPSYNVITIIAIDDVNGNKTGDFIIAVVEYDLNSTVICMDGYSGDIIWENNTIPEMIYSMVLFNDYNSDGINDILIGTYNKIFLLDGSSGAEIWSINYTGRHLKLFADINNDGLTEFISDLNVHNGSNGEILYSLNMSNRITVLDDLNSDNIPEIGVIIDNLLEIRDGNTSELLWNRTTPRHFHFVFTINDVNDDNIPDVICGTCQQDDRMYCLSGINGDVIWSFYHLASEVGIKLGDVNNDGYDDVINVGFLDITCISGYSRGEIILRSSEDQSGNPEEPPILMMISIGLTFGITTLILSIITIILIIKIRKLKH